MWPILNIQIAFNSFSLKTGPLSGSLTWTDITSYVRRWGYKRGRQRQLQRAEVGTLYLELDNADGRFDPENSSSPYYNGATSGGSPLPGDGMRPGKPVRIRATWSDGITRDLFYAHITAWKPEELRRGGEPRVQIDALELLGWVGRGTIGFSASAGNTGAAITDILTTSPFNYSSVRLQVDDGTESCAALASGNYNLQSVLQQYADTEDTGIVFQNGAGDFVFHDHLRRLARQRSIVRQALFDNGPNAPAGALTYERVIYSRDDTEVYNAVEITPSSGTVQRFGAAGGTGTPSEFAIAGRIHDRDLARTTRHLNNSDALRVAQQLNHRYARWVGRHDNLTVEAGDNPALFPAVLDLTISDQIRVVERLYPNGRIRALNSFIEGIQVDVVPEARSWRVRYSLSPLITGINWSIGGKGVAFPPSPTANDLFFREDLNLLCEFDGIRWLTVNEYSLAFNPLNAVPIGTAGQASSIAPLNSTYDLVVQRTTLLTNVQTTNNGSNFWSMEIATSAGLVLHSATTSADAAGTWVRRNVATPLIVSASSVPYILVSATAKTGSPGNIFLYGALWYRLIIP